jgi:amino acid transporter/mannitol/fructose-specific phosphotransferase system IIA component (Ntr-type)
MVATMNTETNLKRELGLWDVFSVSAGAMISSGIFILPAIAYGKSGPGVILAFVIASVLIAPSVFSKAELATAMPRSGGTYFFVERSLGPVGGLFSGLAGWFSLALKSAFAVLGIALMCEVILKSFFDVQLDEITIRVIASVCCVFFTVLNMVSVKQTSRLQGALVVLLLVILVTFVCMAAGSVEVVRFDAFLAEGFKAIFATAGLVFISFGGLTNIAAIAEEIKNPARNLPAGMFAAYIVVSLLYIAVISATVGVLDGDVLAASHAPISDAAGAFMGTTGFVVLLVAAAAAFITTANGGILASSRSLMAMSRDNLLPPYLARISPRFRTPHVSLLVTGFFMIAAIILLDLESLVKTASTLMIILFMLDNASVIIMRESRIQTYQPGFRSPLYPWMQIIAMIAYAAIIIDMGAIPLAISGAFFALSALWYFLFARNHVSRASAVMHIVERVTDRQLQTVTLENELRDILIERDEIVADRFDHLVSDCEIIDIEGTVTMEKAFRRVSAVLCGRLDTDEFVLFEKLLHREQQASTVILPHLAIPHIVVEGHHKFDILLVRAKDGITFPNNDQPVTTMFVLAGSRDERNYHLRALMAIAQIAQGKSFEQKWLTARDTEVMRNLILLSKRKRDSN